MQPKICFFFGVTFFLFVSDWTFGQTGLKDSATVERGSIVYAAYQNAMALRQYDVLIRDESIVDIGPENNSSSIAFTRLRVDWQNERLLDLKRGRQKHVNAAERVSSDEAMSEASSFKNSVSKWNDFRSPIQTAKRSLDDATRFFNICDIRSVGMAEFPDIIRGDDFAKRMKVVGETDFEVQRVNATTAIVKYTSPIQGQQVKYRGVT